MEWPDNRGAGTRGAPVVGYLIKFCDLLKFSRKDQTWSGVENAGELLW